MAFNNSQMALTVDGTRSGVQIVGSNPEWNNRNHHEPTGQEYGNTKWPDFIIASRYVTNALDVRQTCLDLKYVRQIETTRKNGTKGSKLVGNEYGLTYRLRRINSNCLINVIKMLLEKKELEKEVLPKILYKTSIGEKETKRAVLNYKFHRYYAKSFAEGALKKYGNRKNAAIGLWINIHTLNYWLNEEVEDMRVIGRDWRND